MPHVSEMDHAWELRDFFFVSIHDWDHVTLIPDKKKQVSEGDLVALKCGEEQLYFGQVVDVSELCDGVGSQIIQLSAVSVSSSH